MYDWYSNSTVMEACIPAPKGRARRCVVLSLFQTRTLIMFVCCLTSIMRGCRKKGERNECARGSLLVAESRAHNYWARQTFPSWHRVLACLLCCLRVDAWQANVPNFEHAFHMLVTWRPGGLTTSFTSAHERLIVRPGVLP